MRSPLRLAATVEAPVALVFPKPIRAHPVRLSPIAWGTPDRDLARGICRHIVEATPPTVIAFNPRTDARMRRDLRSHGIPH